MNNITRSLLSILSDWKGEFKGAFNIREDGGLRRKAVIGQHKNRVKEGSSRT